MPCCPTPMELSPLLVVPPRPVDRQHRCYRARIIHRDHRPPTTMYVPKGVGIGLSLPVSRTAVTLEGPYPALQATRQRVVLATLVVILGWRHSRFDPDRAWTATKAAVFHDASCHRVLNTLAFHCSTAVSIPPVHVSIIRELGSIFDWPEPSGISPPPQSHSATHVLFFDEGSRGNPGPGGSGTSVVRVDAISGGPAIVWSAAISHVHRSTTNNQAEYRGLITSLRATRHYQWPQLEAVGDSAHILHQLRDYKPPKNLRLLDLYSQVRCLADQQDSGRPRQSSHGQSGKRSGPSSIDTLRIVAFRPT